MSTLREPAAPRYRTEGPAGDAAGGVPPLRPSRPSQATAAVPRGEDGSAQTMRCAKESPPGLPVRPPVEAAQAQRTTPGSRPQSRTWLRRRTGTCAFESPFRELASQGTQKRPVLMDRASRQEEPACFPTREARLRQIRPAVGATVCGDESVI